MASDMDKQRARAFLAWLLQLVASCAWVASVIEYDSYESGDILQLVAALSWTLANAVAAPEALLPLLDRRGEQAITGVRSKA